MTEGSTTSEELEQAKRRIQSLTCTPIDGAWIERLLRHIATLQRSADEMREALSKMRVAWADLYQEMLEADPVGDSFEGNLIAMIAADQSAEVALKALPPQQDAKDGATNGGV